MTESERQALRASVPKTTDTAKEKEAKLKKTELRLDKLKGVKPNA